MRPVVRSRSLKRAVAGLALIPVLTGCSTLGPGSSTQIALVDTAKYEFEFLRCDVETEAELQKRLSEPSIGGDTTPRVIAEYRITNRDDIRRRFDVRASWTDATGVTYGFIPKDTDRMDPGESSVEQIGRRLAAGDVPPYTCTVEVWDSVVDIAFPDD